MFMLVFSYTVCVFLGTWDPHDHVSGVNMYCLCLLFPYCIFSLFFSWKHHLYVVHSYDLQTLSQSVSFMSFGIAKLNVITLSLQKIDCLSRLYSRLHYFSWKPVIFKSRGCLSTKTPGSLLWDVSFYSSILLSLRLNNSVDKFVDCGPLYSLWTDFKLAPVKVSSEMSQYYLFII